MKKLYAILVLGSFLLGAQTQDGTNLSGGGGQALKPSEIQSSKSGAFIGLGMGLGGSSEGKIKWQVIPVATSGTASAQVTTPWRNQWFSFDFNILGGYQYYLNETHGIRGALSLGTGIRNNLNTDAFCINNPASATGASCGYFGEKLTTFNLGLTADYLFDFYNHGDTSIGASLGLGYGFNGGGAVRS